ncbi:hypothetical protein WICPIJ_003593 [Wickerhamomyces pijperi]|uniref:Uncharacterized protein n=1 Tax=Wickerhamomyces pijperi TaxID=599730 RepID=A0A9P8Q9J6_WICPI|nr:hypothetical protein WICPIJ_003593 [Wickerhamomyces pijperi]
MCQALGNRDEGLFPILIRRDSREFVQGDTNGVRMFTEDILHIFVSEVDTLDFKLQVVCDLRQETLHEAFVLGGFFRG